MNYKRFFPVILLALLLSAPVTAARINVATIGEAGLKNLLTAHKNKVLVVNVWATWCKPCRDEFPDLVRLAAFYKDKDVEIVAISADYPDEITAKITGTKIAEIEPLRNDFTC